MIAKSLLIGLMSLVLASCGATPKQESAPVQVNGSSNINRPTLFLATPEFAGNLDVDKVANECFMLQTLSDSIRASAETYQANILVDKSRNSEMPDEYMLRVTYIDVTPHRWVLFSLRPSSTATLKVDIVRNGEVVRSTQKAIGSGVALGACDRLEKIAEAGGRFVAKWSTQQDYN
ncbi:hypothetical protein [Shewanella halotolerans]|uniref:hypothetical protein n=1 Tax=Shewanella halotolerans TaxID=2864204 RepID=UPI001C65D26B|nr:hypothetical protein [Shewanella halotolerans]QYJ88401.1 hypothetical protein K0H81_11280 [Shewanella halotolerans]